MIGVCYMMSAANMPHLIRPQVWLEEGSSFAA